MQPDFLLFTVLTFIPAIHGSYSNVVGLPLAEVQKMLENAL